MSPELAAYDLSSKQTTILTDLNPALRDRRYGAVESMRWQHRYDKDAFAFLVKPLGYRPGTRYPLVVLLDDGMLGQTGTPFLLDGAGQLSGHAIQMLAAQGFVVLYVREPALLRRVMGTPQEGEHMREHIESAVAQLDQGPDRSTADRHIGVEPGGLSHRLLADVCGGSIRRGHSD